MMTKEEAKQSLFNTKIYVDGKSKEIQEKLFEFAKKEALELKEQIENIIKNKQL